MYLSPLRIRNFNLWNVNGDAEYHEEGEVDDKTGRQVPEQVA